MLQRGKYHTVYEVNEEFYIPLNSASNLTFYAVWDLPDDVAKDNVKFGIRLDGTIPYEPANYENSEYSTKIGIDAGNVLKYGVVSGRRWVTANDPSMTKLNPGDKIVPVYTMYYETEDMDDLEETEFDGEEIIWQDGMTVTYEDLSDEEEEHEMLFCFIFNDIFGEDTMSDMISFVL